MDPVEDIEDVTNITGLSKLVNRTHVNEKMDPDALEKQILGSPGRMIQVKDPAKEFDKKMKTIKGGDDHKPDKNNVLETYGLKPVQSRYKPAEISESSSFSAGSSRSSRQSSRTSSRASSRRSSRASSRVGSSESDSLSQSESGNRPQYKLPEILDVHAREKREKHGNRESHNARAPQPYPPYSQQPYTPYPQQPYPPQPYPQQPYGNYRPGNPYSMDAAIAAYGGGTTEFDLISKEKENEEISALLGDIGELKHELEQDEVDITDVPTVTKDSTKDEVKSVYNILKRRYERRRLNSLGNEGIIAIAQGLEYIFDGERKIGPYKPDLTNWNNTVRTKLRKMRYETSNVVGVVLDKLDVGSAGRIAIELVPSAFLHSKMRKDSRGKPSYSTDQMSAVVATLRDYE